METVSEVRRQVFMISSEWASSHIHTPARVADNPREVAAEIDLANWETASAGDRIDDREAIGHSGG